MALTINRQVDHYVDQELRTLMVKEEVHIFQGALVGLDSGGYARPLVAGDVFAGIAYEEKDNTDGDDGSLSVRVYTEGDFAFPLSGAVAASIARPVFAVDDETLTAVGNGNSYVGVVQDVTSSGQIILRIDPFMRQVKTVTIAVEDLSAGADIGVRAVHHFASEGWITAARVVNQETSAAGIDNSNTCVVALSTAAGSVASVTFNTATPFPDANAEHDMGTISLPRATAGTTLLLAVTNGATANPGRFLVEVDYV